MQKTPIRAALALLLAACLLSHFSIDAHAQSSLGIGTNDAISPVGGPFSGFLQWVNVHQQRFYRALTGALKAMRDDGSNVWILIGLSFAYGVFHAAGPGHGKAVISSYMLANEVALRRGVLLSFISAILQGLVATLLMAAVFLVLRGTSVRMTDAAWFLELVSYAAIAVFGAWLLWRKLVPRLAGWRWTQAPARSLSAAAAAPAGAAIDMPSAFRLEFRSAANGGSAANAGAGFECKEMDASVTGEVCATCGHAHMPDPAMLSGPDFNWRTAWAAVAAVGIRPCSGALVVLTFAFLNGLWLGGILSVLAMSVGTALTVALLATLAVTAKNYAVAFARDGRISNAINAIVEIGGAAAIMLLGIVLFAASWSA